MSVHRASFSNILNYCHLNAPRYDNDEAGLSCSQTHKTFPAPSKRTISSRHLISMPKVTLWPFLLFWIIEARQEVEGSVIGKTHSKGPCALINKASGWQEPTKGNKCISRRRSAVPLMSVVFEAKLHCWSVWVKQLVAAYYCTVERKQHCLVGC